MKPVVVEVLDVRVNQLNLRADDLHQRFEWAAVFDVTDAIDGWKKFIEVLRRHDSILSSFNVTFLSGVK